MKLPTTHRKLTPAQKVILLHRLTLSDCLAEVLSSSEIPEGTSDAEFDARVAKRYPILQDKADRLVAYVETHSAIPATLDEDERNILIDCIEGSTWFAEEGFDGNPPLWWSSQHRSADALAEKIYKDEVGRLRVELAASTHESEQLRSALSSALDTLEEDAIAQRAFWGDDDKHGIAAEAERIYKMAKSALLPKGSPRL